MSLFLQESLIYLLFSMTVFTYSVCICVFMTPAAKQNA